MKATRPALVYALLVTLAPACSDSGDCGKATQEPETRAAVVGPADLARFVDDDGTIDDAECDAACAGLFDIREPESCEAVAAEAPADTGDTGGDTAATGDWYEITCFGVVSQYCLGRPPAGLAPMRRTLPDAGAWAAHAAALEAVSVRAFVDLERDLSRLGAPRALRRQARSAAADERRHTRVMVSLARRRGAPVRRLRVAPTPAPTLTALARDNLVHGCVEETWSALVAGWQATHAVDADVRAAMTVIAPDEARHATFAWALHRWFTTRGAAPDAETAVAAAIARIRAAMEQQDPTLAARLGLPHGEEGCRLLGTLERELWQA